MTQQIDAEILKKAQQWLVSPYDEETTARVK